MSSDGGKRDVPAQNKDKGDASSADNHGTDGHECSVCHNEEPFDKVSNDGMRITRFGNAPDNENGPSWLNEDGTVDPIEFALSEVGYLDFEDDNFQDDFAQSCAMYGFKPWEMW
ncbi:hypothetical protein Pmar_PMAR020720 [Perkinsus marinus ATCC 50983]|uniref:Uncharacterized protein n=1 Tax=Perkinsus marinus (strain ATCC 50983 / TXsc) TaxID=423536 RepID=C5KVX8_PERM5|nr:hypothetical protein Pmar_PMAR020720 [Perkinsus marinus ATCC 50983]EER11369.1 hypothetical protein Pmar_PMAR020720 [Perkinsus marinus ATCC 50983]|eukprot:XP_002779574.1 hypothetical protein Pmar_PMAR020720 [Perkinsus marinus ATCC 50983]